MKMYYKVRKDTKTGLKIKAVVERINEFDKTLDELRAKYGFREVWGDKTHVRVVKAVGFDQEPDMKLWSKARNFEGGYYPRQRCKVKYLIEDFETLEDLSVRNLDLDNIMGGNDIACQADFHLTNPSYYLFAVEKKWLYNIPEDCEQITEEGYINLTE